jgi:TonB-linked SusC/RagA family outer membrane protein
MKTDAVGLDEVVVVGYGVQKRSDITGSVASVSLEDIEKSASINVLDALKGQIAGLDITTNNNSPGSQEAFLVRGTNSLTASNKPLIILDGIPYDGNFNDINPNDIASVEVLKDASSAAIYGSRASNGVILVTSRKGKAGKPKINLTSRFGIQDQDDRTIQMMDKDGYINKTRELARFQFGDPERWQEILPANLIENYNNGKTVDWVDDMVIKHAFQQEHNLSMSGADEKVNYYTSLNYLEENGVYYNGKMDRISFRANVDYDITDWLKTGTKTMITQTDNSGFEASYSEARKLSPFADYYEEDGVTLALYPLGGSFLSPGHPKGYAKYDTNDNIRQQLFSNLYFELKAPFLTGLSYRLNYGLKLGKTSVGQYRTVLARAGKFSGGLATTNNSLSKDWTFENLIKYNRIIDKHNLDFTGLYSREYGQSETANMQGRGFPNDLLLYHAIQTAEEVSGSTSYNEISLVSYMARFNYSYSSKYLLTLTYRRDGFSGFGSGNKWGDFPSVAIGWNIAKESFMKDIDFINNLKLRASYGINGNQAVGSYAAMATIASRPYTFGDGGITAPGLVPNKMANPFLGWESTESINLGLDYGFFDNRLSGSIEAYKSHTSDLLLSRQIPATNGFTTVIQNIGETENWGMEFSISSINVSSSNFTWRTDFNIYANRNKIVQLYGGDETDDIANHWFIGEPIQVVFSYEFDGLWQEGEDMANSAQPTAQPGYVKIKDIDENGVINSDDRDILGRSNPDFIAGLTNNFRYKNFDLSIVLHGKFGGLKGNQVYSYYQFISDEGYHPEKWEVYNFFDIDYWTPENTNAAAPAIYQPADWTFGQYYENPTFVRIREASLRYTFPKSVLDKLPIETLRAFITGKNLYTFTGFSVGDPELAQNDAYPMTRVISLGLNIGF